MIFKERLFFFFIILIISFPLSAFSSRKKVKELSDDELQQKREQALAEIAERKNASVINEEAVSTPAPEVKDESPALEISQKAEPETPPVAEPIEPLVTEEEKERQAKLAKQMELALEKEKNKSSAKKNQKEYLSDYMVSEIETVEETTQTNYEIIRNPDETDAQGVSLLMKAARLGNEWQVKRLLESGADSNLKDKDGWTALMYAVRYNEGLECVELLIQSGTNVKLTNNYGLTALSIAATYNNNPQILSCLLKNYKASDKDVLRALVLLISEQNIPEDVLISKLNIILDTALPINILYEGKTPLMYAAAYGNSTKVIQMLLDYDASVTLRSTDGKTAFDYASKNKNLIHDASYWALNVK